jgi:putative glutamine amidotransferase
MKNLTQNSKKIKPERDQLEMSIFLNAKTQNLPILAICRGIHVINAALGGTIIQDIESTVPNCVQHTQKASSGTPTHNISIEEDSFLYGSLGLSEVRINSFHHQALGKVAPTLKVTARAHDGIIEAVEGINKDDSLIIGVQWHPEDMVNDLSYTAFVYRIY